MSKPEAAPDETGEPEGGGGSEEQLAGGWPDILGEAAAPSVDALRNALADSNNLVLQCILMAMDQGRMIGERTQAVTAAARLLAASAQTASAIARIADAGTRQRLAIARIEAAREKSANE